METLLARYKAEGADLGIPPEVLGADDIFVQWKNIITFARKFHRGEQVSRESLEQSLDILHAIVLTLQTLAEERYA